MSTLKKKKQNNIEPVVHLSADTWRTMGVSTGEYNLNGNSKLDHEEDEKTPFTEQEEVNGNEKQLIEKCESQHNSSGSSEEDGSEGVLTKLKSDAVYREKFLISLGIMWSFFVLVSDSML